MPVDPTQKSAYDAARQAARSAKTVAECVEAWRRAAQVFAGSRAPEELELRFMALTEAAGALRRAHQLEQADAAFGEVAATIARESGPSGFDYGYAHYARGLCRAERDDDAGAVESLALAQQAFQSAGKLAEAAVAGASRGLSLLRLARWAESAAVLEPLRAQIPESDPQTRAAVLNNLAIALARCGRAAEAVEVGAQALAFRTRLDGFAHPNTIETALVQAYALVEAGRLDEAGEAIRRAAGVVFANAGEAHCLFADALLVEARRQAHLGDGVAAEALARRALHVLRVREVEPAVARQREADARAIPALWRTRKGGAGRVFWKVEMQHTLRRYRAATLDFEGSGELPKTWFLVLPQSWTAADAAYATHLVFADSNAFLNAREPADANALDATRVEAQPLDALDRTEVEAAFRDCVWEASAAFDLTGGSTRVLTFEELFGRSA